MSGEKIFLTKKQAMQKFPFLTENMLKNLLFKDVMGFRSRVARKLGRRILLSETDLVAFLESSKA